MTNAPVARRFHTAVWTGARMIVYGGILGPNALGDGAAYDPVNDTWTAIATTDGRERHSAVWNGSQMLVWGYLPAGARYDPATNSWVAMTATNAPEVHSNAVSAWTGTRFLVWGGNFGSSGVNEGSQNLALNLWVRN